MANVARAETTARRVRVFECVAAGKTTGAILTQERISSQQLEDDLRAINERLVEWASERTNQALAYAIAQYQRVIDEAWRCHAVELKTERRWLMKRYDRVTQQPAMDGGTVDEQKPPPYKPAKAAYLQTIVTATGALCKVAGLDKSTLEHTGSLTFADLLTLSQGDSGKKSLRLVR